MKFKINLILSLDVNCCYVLINGLRYPLAIEDFLNLSDKNYFMKSLGYFYDLYGRVMGIERILFVNSNLRSVDIDDYSSTLAYLFSQKTFPNTILELKNNNSYSNALDNSQV